jgi:hypothetical protein
VGLLILDGAMLKYEIGGRYFGTHRVEPIFIEHEGAIEVNKLWDWYIHAKTQNGTLSLSDLFKARTLIQEYRKWGMEFQLVELAPNADALKIGQFIGYDLSFRSGYSLLSWGVTYHSRIGQDSKKDELRPITLLTERYFQPRLNVYGLFADIETVTFLFEVLCAIQRLKPNFFESNLDEFEPVALGIVDEST